jgi:hypothetical protein
MRSAYVKPSQSILQAVVECVNIHAVFLDIYHYSNKSAMEPVFYKFGVFGERFFDL